MSKLKPIVVKRLNESTALIDVNMVTKDVQQESHDIIPIKSGYTNLNAKIVVYKTNNDIYRSKINILGYFNADVSNEYLQLPSTIKISFKQALSAYAENVGLNAVSVNAYGYGDKIYIISPSGAVFRTLLISGDVELTENPEL